MITISSMNLGKNKKFGIAGAFIVLAVPFIIMLLNPDGDLNTKQSLCSLKLMTGLPCPGCGITKSIIALYEGNIYKSLAYHLFGPAVLLYCLMTIFYSILSHIRKKEYLAHYLYSMRTGYVIASTLGVYHFFRLINFLSIHSFDQILQQSIWQ